MKIVRFTHNTHGRRARVHYRRQYVVICGRAARTFGHAKGGKGRACIRARIKKRAIGRVGTGPAAFDVIDPQRVQSFCNRLFFLDRKLDALGLLPIAQSRIIEVKAFFGHWSVFRLIT